MDNDFTNPAAEADKNKDLGMQEFEFFHRSDNLLWILKRGINFLHTGVQLKSRPYFNMSNLFTKIYNMLYYTTNLYLQ